MKDQCEIEHINNSVEQITMLKDTMKDKDFADAAGLFKALSDPTRVKIAYLLTIKEQCVCDVAEIAEVSTATASHHLRLLRDIGIASYRKRGKQAFYCIMDETIKQLLNLTIEEKVGEQR